MSKELIDPSEHYLIILKGIDRVFDVEGSREEDGTNVILYSENKGANQQWRFVPLEDGYYRIESRGSGKCLDVKGRSQDDGANIIIWPRNDSENQQWELVEDGPDYYALRARHSGKCLDAKGTEDFTEIQQYSCEDTDSQRWRLERFEGDDVSKAHQEELSSSTQPAKETPAPATGQSVESERTAPADDRRKGDRQIGAALIIAAATILAALIGAIALLITSGRLSPGLTIEATETDTPTAIETDVLAPVVAPTTVTSPPVVQTPASAPSTLPTPTETSMPLTPTGKIAFVSSAEGDANIYLIDAECTHQSGECNSTPRQLTFSPYQDKDPAWSPDGTLVAFVSKRATGIASDIWVMNSDGTNQRPLTKDDADDLDPTWSPDGKRIAFASYRSGNFDIFMVDINCLDGSRGACDSSPSLTQLTDHPGNDEEPVWSPISSHEIAVVSHHDPEHEVPDIYLINTECPPIDSKCETSTLTEGGGHDPAWSPDGGQIAYWKWHGDDENKNWGIYVMQADGSQPVPLINNFVQLNYDPTWSPEGSLIAFTRRGDIYVVEAECAYRPEGPVACLDQARRLTDSPAAHNEGAAWQPQIIAPPLPTITPVSSPIPAKTPTSPSPTLTPTPTPLFYNVTSRYGPALVFIFGGGGLFGILGGVIFVVHRLWSISRYRLKVMDISEHYSDRDKVSLYIEVSNPARGNPHTVRRAYAGSSKRRDDARIGRRMTQKRLEAGDSHRFEVAFGLASAQIRFVWVEDETGRLYRSKEWPLSQGLDDDNQW